MLEPTAVRVALWRALHVELDPPPRYGLPLSHGEHLIVGKL